MRVEDIVDVLKNVNVRVPVIVKDADGDISYLQWNYFCDDGWDEIQFWLTKNKFGRHLDSDSLKMIMDYEYRNQGKSLFDEAGFSEFEFGVIYPTDGDFDHGGSWTPMTISEIRYGRNDVYGENIECITLMTKSLLPQFGADDTEKPWYEEKWYDDDIIEAMKTAGVNPTPANMFLFKAHNQHIFDDKSERNAMIADKVERMKEAGVFEV